MSKHTPGPWYSDYFGNIWARSENIHSKVAATKNLSMAEMYDKPTDEQEIYNAHLIAAAPELLEALEVAVRILKNDGYLPSMNMESAIAKARGES